MYRPNLTVCAFCTHAHDFQTSVGLNDEVCACASVCVHISVSALTLMLNLLRDFSFFVLAFFFYFVCCVHIWRGGSRGSARGRGTVLTCV